MTIKEEMLQELYDALNVDTEDMLKANCSNPSITSTSQLRVYRCQVLASDWIRKIKNINPNFKLKNRLLRESIKESKQ